MSDVVLLVHAGATWFMVGLIWFVQIVHYPLFTGVGSERWVTYANRHRTRTTFVVMPVMLIELITAAMLALDIGIRPIPGVWPWLGAALLAVVWVSTFAVQVPLHARLGGRYSVSTIRALATTNWIRTIAWSARGIVALVMLQ